MLPFTHTFYFTFKAGIQNEEKKQRDARERPGRGGRERKQMSRRIN